MAVNANDVIAGLDPARRRKVEERAAELIAEEMTLRDLRKARQLTQVSVARELGIGQDDFGPDSDVDLLVRFHPDAHRTLLDMAQMQEELSLMFGRQADLIEHDAVQSSRNYIRRNAILRTAETVYAA